jgi:hypothetical protein
MFNKTKTQEYSKDIQMVHNEFMTAADVLLEEAREIIKNTNLVNEDKVNRLKSLGFTASKEVEDTKEAIALREMSKETARLIEYYKMNYPLNKFITEDQVQKICEKYNLVYGAITRYTGFIPDKNLKEIESWKGLKDVDNIFAVVRDRSGNNDIDYLMENDFINKEAIERFKKVNDYDFAIYSDRSKSHLLKNVVVGTYEPFAKIFKYDKENFIIAAPLKDMKIDNTEEVKNYKIVKKHIPDPVVMCRCKGGFLILTAWGDEASDPLVVNEINN